MAEINDKRFDMADIKLQNISMAADNLECIADSYVTRQGKASYEANALLFTANYLQEEIEKIRRLLFTNDKVE